MEGFNLDAELHLAQLMHKHAGAKKVGVRFLKWHVERRLGRGGMGTVYLARDLSLDRHVALKVIRATAGQEFAADQTRTIREAQALASCHHKNIVQIISIERSPPGLVVLELEYVDGSTLRQWTTAEHRSVVEIVRAYADAAEGLAAIHRQGIVHRDIKPDNLLISTSGVVKVADFSLAIGEESTSRYDPHKPPSSDSPALSLRVTSTGAIVGTQGYIAPEALAGQDATTSSDQFSLASALFESLFGCLPYRGDTPHALAMALRTGELQVPPTPHAVPKWLLRALRRALAYLPDERYASVDQLAAALRWGLGRHRRWKLFVGILGLLATSAALAWWMKPPPPDPCIDIGRPFYDSWMDVRSELAATENPNPGHKLLITSLDDGVRRWVDTRRRLCASKRRRAPEDVEAIESDAHQEACLEHTLNSYQALLEGPVRSIADNPARTAELAAEVEAFPSCEDRRIYARWPLTYSEVEDTTLASKLAEALALELKGQRTAAELRARDVASVDPQQHPRRHAEALFRIGHILGSQHRLSAALETLDEAYRAAVRSGHDAVACQVAVYRAKMTANVGLDVAASHRALQNAEAWRDRVGLRSPILEADLLEAKGLLLESRGKFSRAVELHREALAQRRRVLGESHPDVAKSLHNLANALSESDSDSAQLESIARLNEAVLLRERILGANHPTTAATLFDRGRLESELSPAAARPTLLRAHTIFLTAQGNHKAALANVQIALAQLARKNGSLDEAQSRLDRASELQEGARDLPSTHFDRALLLLEQGTVALLQQNFDKASGCLRQAVSLFRSRDPDSSPALDALALWIEALRGLEDHHAIANAVLPEGPKLSAHIQDYAPADRGKYAWYIADSLKHEGALAEASEFFRIALRAYEQLGDDSSIAELRWELAQLVDSGSERQSLALAARDFYRDQKNHQMVATISRWIKRQAKHEPTNSP